MHSIKRSTLLLLVAFAAVPMFGADLVSVTTSAGTIAHRGSAGHGDVLITNISTTDVRVTLNVRVVFFDGTVQTLSGTGDPGTLAPGGGYALSVSFPIPTNAALGQASFIAEVSASAAGGLQENETSSATFFVLP